MVKRVFIFFIIFISIFATENKEFKYNKIASLTLSSDEMLLSLASKNRIVGLSGKINKEKDMSYVWKESKNYPEIESNIEVLCDLNPDLIVAADWMKKDTISQLESLGIEVYVYKTPKNFKEQEKLILEYSKILGVEDKGEEIVNSMDSRIAKLQKEISKNFTHKPRILLYTSFETTEGENTTFDDMVKLINGINVATQGGIKGSNKISKEKVIELNPEVIIIPIWREHIDSEKFVDFVKNDKSFENVDAVKNKKVYVILFKNLSTTSQYMIDGIENLAKIVYGMDI